MLCRMSKRTRAAIGTIGEDLAADFVINLGWSVLHRNWRCRYGELDLIVLAGETLVIVEVKTRATSMYDDPAEAVTPSKVARMRRLAGIWLSEQDTWYPVVRFDIISVKLDRLDPADTARAGIRHHVGITD